MFEHYAEIQAEQPLISYTLSQICSFMTLNSNPDSNPQFLVITLVLKKSPRIRISHTHVQGKDIVCLIIELWNQSKLPNQILMQRQITYHEVIEDPILS